MAACSEATPTADGKQAESSEREDDSDDDSDSRSTQSKPDAKVSDSKGAKDAGKSTAKPADAGTKPGDKPVGGGKDGGAAAASSGGLPCNVEKILTTNCGTCHNEELVAGAPMKLTAQADFMATGTEGDKTIVEIAKKRINATSKPMPPPPGKLSATDLAALNEWLDEGAPASNEKCTDTPAPSGDGMDFDRTGLECHKLLAHAAGSKEKYMAATGETYINFGFKAPWSGTGYMVVSSPSIDNAKVVHHWLLYKENVQDGSVAATIGQHAGELQTGWAPGGKPIDLRKHGSVGVEMEGSYSVEIHYNNNTGAPAADQSGVELCLVKQKPTNIASLSWLGYDQGGTISYATGVCLDPSTSWTSTCVPANQTQPVHIVNVVPHMHQTGTHMKAVINSPDGKTRTLHDEVFDFNYQIAYDKDEVLMPGETITTTCTFSAPNCAGQSTSQEMCYLYTLHYPANSLVDYGPEGTLMHGDGVCLGQ